MGHARCARRRRAISVRFDARHAGRWLEGLEARRLLSAVVATDRLDYAPGSIAQIHAFSDASAGADYAQGETVQFRVLRIDPTDGSEETLPGSEPWRVADGVWSLDGGNTTFEPYVENGVRYAPDLDRTVNGALQTTWYVDPIYLGATLEVKGTGLTSGAEASAQFTDGNLDTGLSAAAAGPFAATHSVTVVAGGPAVPFFIRSTVNGATGASWQFQVNQTYSLSAGTATGSNPVTYSPSAQAGGDPNQVFTTSATIAAAAGQAPGTFTVAIQETVTQTGANPSLAAGGSATLTVNVIAANAPPVVAANSASVTVSEGQTATNGGTYSDVNAGNNVAITASVGTVSKTGTNSGTWSWSLGTTDGPAQSQTVTITANDGNGGVTSTTFALTVNNANPTATFASAGAVSEGSAGSVSFSSPSDPSTADTSAGFRYAYDFDNNGTFDSGDGTYAGSGTAASATVPASLLDDGPGTRTVRGRILDKDGGFTDYTTTITINNVAPTATLRNSGPVDEGSPATVSFAGQFDPSAADTAAGFVYSYDFDNDGTFEVTGSASASATVPASYLADGPGTYTVRARIADKDGGAPDYTTAIQVNNVAPTVTLSGPASADEGQTRHYTFTTTDPGADTFSIVAVSGGSVGTVSNLAFDGATGAGSFDVTFADGAATSTVSVQVQDSDGAAGNVSAIDVAVANVAPVVTAAADQAADEGEDKSFDLGSFTDPAGPSDQPYVVTVDWGDGSADTTFNAASPGSLGAQNHTYADNGNYTVTVTVTEDNGAGDSGSATFQAAVTNVAPTIVISGAASANEGSSYSLTLGAVTDPGDDTVTDYVVHWGDGSSDTYTGNGVKTHTYADGPNGYSITVDLVDEDGTHLNRANGLSVTVDNVAPTLTISGAADVNEASLYTLGLSSSDPGADTITSWTIDWGDGDVEVVPGDPLSATHTYDDGPASYTISATATDEDGTFAANTVAVSVHNLPPTATDNAYALNEDGSAAGNVITDDTGGGVDSDPAGAHDPLTVTAVNGNPVAAGPPISTANGTVTLDPATGAFTYTPNANFFGADGFTYTIGDGDGSTSTATVTLTVAEVNDPPVANDDSATTDEDMAVTGNVLANDTDADNDDGVTGNDDDLDVALVTGPAHGAVTLDVETGAYTYTPAANFFGTDSFTYSVSDGRGGADTATVTITVSEVNDAPVAAADSASTDEDAAVSGNVLANDADPDNADGFTGNEDDVDAVLDSNPAHGALVFDAETGAYTYTPGANFFGTDSFTYHAVDVDGAASGVVTVTINVTEVNDPPVAADDAASTAQDTAVGGNVLTNDTDPDNTDGISGNEDTCAVVAHTAPAHGTLVINADGSFTYTPFLGYAGTDSFTYTVGDGPGGGTDTATVQINVAAATPGSVYLRDDDCYGGTMLIINGTALADNIQVSPATGGGVVVHFNGVAQGTFVPTGRVIVFGYAGDDQITLAGSVPNVAWVYGDDGSDMLNLGNGGGIAWGGNGNDHINGGSAADILIGGEGADRIVGNPGDDILCAGYTDYDDRFTAADHEDAWCHLYHEWARKDLATKSVPGDSSYTAFEQRIDHLTGTVAGGYNGVFRLNNTTVDDDNDYDQIDMLTGAAGEDWFLWTKGEDKVSGMSSTEGAEDLDNIS